jgi:signal transduction histidine kinase
VGGGGRREGPSLAALPSLLEATRVDGLTTELSVTGDRAGIPSTVDVTGYRIVQESLTNVVRHAGARRACVTVEYQPGRVSLSVLDDGAGGPVGLGGSGLASMAARARALGGSVQAGPGRKGFEVKAVLPYQNVAA